MRVVTAVVGAGHDEGRGDAQADGSGGKVNTGYELSGDGGGLDATRGGADPDGAGATDDGAAEWDWDPGAGEPLAEEAGATGGAQAAKNTSPTIAAVDRRGIVATIARAHH